MAKTTTATTMTTSVLTTQVVTATRAHGLSWRDARVGSRPGHEAAERRHDAGEEVGHADEVADDVVAVEADPGDELVDDQAVLPATTTSSSGAKPVAAYGGHDGQREDPVEVDAAEVDAQSAGAAEAVRLGDVGVEDAARRGRSRRRSHPAGRRRSGTQRRGRTRGRPSESQERANRTRESAGVSMTWFSPSAEPARREQPDVAGQQRGRGRGQTTGVWKRWRSGRTARRPRRHRRCRRAS